MNGPRPFVSVRRKVMRVVMTTTGVALLVSACALLFYELLASRETWFEDLQTQANLVAQSSVSALTFNDPRVADENLHLLRLRPQIEAAAIYSADGELFAAYAAPGQPAPPQRLTGSTAGHAFDGGRLALRQPIVANGETLGTMALRARFDVLPRLLGYGAILGVVMLASLGLARLVATRLQRSITEPIVAIAAVAREVVHQRNYSLRAPQTSDDEIGQLVDAFNDMLRELGGQAEALKTADRRKDEFLATLAHELRNPLAALSTALAVLARDELPLAMRDKMRAITTRQLQQLVRLIDDLLEVSRISTGRLTLQPEALDLPELVRMAVESVAPAMQDKQHRLEVAWPAGSAWVMGDRTRLAQVFINLLNNAAKYTDAGGRIEVFFRIGEERVDVGIVDNGIGIDPARQEEIFGLFVQVDQSLERGRAGLGVGLSLARQLVELHGGSVQVASAGLGRGACFSVCLPLAAAPGCAGPVPVARSGDGSRGTRILLADDNRDFADALAQLLRARGHQVQVVHDGLAAFEAIQAACPRVGLFDIGMPGMNGYELAAAVRRHHGPDTLVLTALTGWGQQNDRARAREAGFDHHLVKPVDMDALFDLLAKAAA